MGIIRRSGEPGNAASVRYRRVREALRGFMVNPQRSPRDLAALRNFFSQKTEDGSLKDFDREDARLSMDVIDAFGRMQNQIGGMAFSPAPSTQPHLMIAGVDISIYIDAFTTRSRAGVEEVGGILLRTTKADEESDAASAKRRDMGAYAATLALMQMQQNLRGDRVPHYQLCASIDVQFEEVFFAPRSFGQRANNIENACRVISAMWDRV